MDYLGQYQKELNYKAIKNSRIKVNKLLNSKGNKKLTEAYNNIKNFHFNEYDLESNIIKFGENTFDEKEKVFFKENLMQLSPWRIGPFSLGGILIDSEWKSFYKWEKIKKHIIELKGKKVCDLGASSSYYLYKLLSLNPNFALGLDPMPRCYWQFHSLQKFAPQNNNAFFEAFGWQELAYYLNFFDFILCMGVLYHHKDPITLLRYIYKALKNNGQLILECQGIEGKEEFALFPQKTYAKSKGTYFLPMKKCLINWLKRAYFKDIEVITSYSINEKEQRSTEWAKGQSYKDFIDKKELKTVEGYPLPLRIYVKARKK